MDTTAPEKPSNLARVVPQPCSARIRLRYLAIAFSMANLCLITAWFASLFDSDFGYFNKVPVSAKILGALFTNLAVLTLLFWSAGLWVRRVGGRFIVLAANVAMVSIWAIPLDFYRSTILLMPDRIVVGGLKSPLGLTALLLIVIALAFQHQRMARISTIVFLVLSPLGLFTVGKSLFVMLGWMHIAQDSTTVHPLATPLSSTNLPRVIWVVFDE